MTYKPPPCEVCGTWTEVLETRTHKNGTIKRRIECANLHRFTVYDHSSTEERMPQQAAVQAIDRTAGPPRAPGVVLACRNEPGMSVHALPAGSGR